MEILIWEWLETAIVNDNPPLVNITSFFTALAVITAPVSYVIKRLWSKRAEKTAISKMLYEEWGMP